MSNDKAATQVTYAQAGVDIVEGARAVDAIKETVHSTYRPEVVGDIGGFGGLFSIAAAKGMEDPLLVSGTDGVGTKLKIAQMIDKHDTIGIDLVAMCVNDILATGAEPLFFLDYVAVGKLDSKAMAEIVGGIGEGCRQAGCALIGGEMAEHPGVMDPKDYDVSGFCVGIVDRPKMLDPALVREGDVLVGLASSGLHSNGYSLARKVCLEGKSIEEVTRPVDELGGIGVAEALLTPTRIYVKPVRSVVDSCPKAVNSGAVRARFRSEPQIPQAFTFRITSSLPGSPGSVSLISTIHGAFRKACFITHSPLAAFSAGSASAPLCFPV